MATEELAMIRASYAAGRPVEAQEYERNLSNEIVRLRADNERLRTDFVRFFDAVCESNERDNTGGDSAVSVTLWSWAQRAAELTTAVAKGATDA